MASFNLTKISECFLFIFFQELYLYKSESNLSKHTFNEFLNNIKLPYLSKDISMTLDSPITLQGCEAAIKDMHKGKSTEPDGIPA